MRGIDGRYLSQAGVIIPDRITLIYSDLPLNLEDNSELITKYTANLKQIAFESLQIAFESLNEETILIVITRVFHIV